MQTNRDPNEIRRQIERTRDSMSETIDAIAFKLDVPSRVKERVSDGVSAAKQKVTESVSNAKEALRNGIDSATGPAVPVSTERPARGS
jgi:hypothetical protein